MLIFQFPFRNISDSGVGGGGGGDVFMLHTLLPPPPPQKKKKKKEQSLISHFVKMQDQNILKPMYSFGK